MKPTCKLVLLQWLAALVASACYAQTASVLRTESAASRTVMGAGGRDGIVRFDTETWPAGIAPKVQLPQEAAYSYEFDSVDIEEVVSWLKWLNLAPPAKIEGEVSGWIWAQRGEAGWLALNDYRLEGEIRSPQLTIEQWRITDALLRFGFSDGVWYVSSLSGAAAAAEGGDIGVIDMAAKLPTADPQTLEISGVVTRLAVEPLLAAFGVDLRVRNTPGRLEAAASVPLASLDDPRQWSAAAQLEIDELLIAENLKTSLSSGLTLQDGNWQVDDMRLPIGAEAASGELVVDAHGELSGVLAFQVNAVGQEIAVDDLLAMANQNLLAENFRGMVNVAVDLSGNVEVGLLSANAQLKSATVEFFDTVIRDVAIRAMLDKQSKAPELLVVIDSAQSAGGSLRGFAQWSSLAALADGLPDQLEVDFQGWQLSRVNPRLLPIAFDGIADGQIRLACASDADQLGGGADSVAISDLQGDDLKDKEAVDAASSEVSVNHARLLSSRAELRLRIRDFAAAESTLGTLYLSGTKKTGEPLVNFDLQDAANTIAASGSVRLADPSDDSSSGFAIAGFESQGRLSQFRAVLFPEQAQKTTRVVASGDYQISGQPGRWLDRGRAELTKLDASLSGQTVRLSDLQVVVTPQEFRLEKFQVSDGAGTLRGSSRWQRLRQGQDELNLQISQVSLQPYFATTRVRELQDLDASISLEARLRRDARKSDPLVGWRGTVSGRVQELKLQGIEMGDVTCQGTLANNQARVELGGNLLSGALSGNADLLLESNLDGKSVAIQSLDANWTGIELRRVMSVVMGPRVGLLYDGVASFEVRGRVENSRAERAGELIWEGRAAIPNFIFGRERLATQLSANVEYNGGKLSVREFRGGLAGGQIEASGLIQLDQQNPPRGNLQFNAERLRLPALIAMISPDYVSSFSGTASYRGRASIGRGITLTGGARVRDAELFALPIQDVRTRMEVLLSSAGGFQRMELRNVHGTALGGRLDGDLSLAGGAKLQLESFLRLGNGAMDQLSCAMGFEHIVGTGKFDAIARLRSDDALDLNSLRGPVHFDFESGDAQSVPVLSELTGIVPLLQLGSTDITGGSMDGVLGRGRLRIANLFLNSDAFWLVADGSAALAGGRLDVNALLQSGGGIDQQLASEAGQNLVALALPQLALLSEVSDLIQNRSIYFHVGGTANHPVIQLQTAQVIGKALLQNVRRQVLAVPSINDN